jgi:hypothetical protein
VAAEQSPRAENPIALKPKTQQRRQPRPQNSQVRDDSAHGCLLRGVWAIEGQLCKVCAMLRHCTLLVNLVVKQSNEFRQGQSETSFTPGLISIMADSLELHQLVYAFLQTKGMKKTVKTFAKEAAKVVRLACKRSAPLRLCIVAQYCGLQANKPTKPRCLLW